MVLGSFLPWVEIRSGAEANDISGFTVGGALRPLLAGTLVIILMICTIVSDSLRLFATAAIVSLVGTGATCVRYVRIRDGFGELPVDVSATIGIGMYVCMAGGVAALFGSVIAANE